MIRRLKKDVLSELPSKRRQQVSMIWFLRSDVTASLCMIKGCSWKVMNGDQYHQLVLQVRPCQASSMQFWLSMSLLLIVLTMIIVQRLSMIAIMFCVIIGLELRIGLSFSSLIYIMFWFTPYQVFLDMSEKDMKQVNALFREVSKLISFVC